MNGAVRNYVLVTAAYWAFTLTDGALRMLVLLHFDALGYGPIELAFLFVLYELCGVFTNLAGGWLAAHRGLRATLLDGLLLQIVALVALAYLPATVAFVMGAQALSGIAKDLTKMSSKSAIKLLVPEDASATLFRWVALLTGSKNALKGAGFFLGGVLLAALGYRAALLAMAVALAAPLALATFTLPGDMGRMKGRTRFGQLFAKSRAINVISLARFFLFGARDIWFVVGVPVFLAGALGWRFTAVGGFLAAWVIGYGVVQSLAPPVIARFTGGRAPRGRAATWLAFLLAAVMAAVAAAVTAGARPDVVVLAGLGVFGVVFAINSSAHSYLILAYSEGDRVALNVGFYYMANAGGRLAGTLLSGITYQAAGLVGCLWASTAFALAAGASSLLLPRGERPLMISQVTVEGSD